MDNQKDAIRTYFAKLGLEAEIADIYLALHTHGPQTISALARTAKVERTRIYRLLEHLTETNLVEVEMDVKRGIIKAAPVANLRILINQREEELKNLHDELGLVEQILARNSLSDPASRVQFYRGPEGIRQMLWNELEAKTEVLGYNYRILEEATGKKFMERWTDTFEERRLGQRLLLNDDFAQSWQEGKSSIGTHRQVKGIAYHVIQPSVFRIRHSCDIYDDVTAYYHWKADEVFGIEIYNQDIADSQRQMFELLWPQSKPETRLA
jgi:sugar-specific transcriptional regulator TrmB